MTCACYLARAGLKVLVLEQYRAVGGMTVTEEVALPGFWSDIHASGYQLAHLSPVPHELRLLDPYELIPCRMSAIGCLDGTRKKCRAGDT